MVSELIDSHQAVLPWLTRDNINNTLRKRDREKGTVVITTNAALMTTDVTETTPTIANDSTATGYPTTESTASKSTATKPTAQVIIARNKGGRSVKSTNKKKKTMS